jgi:hypothetical protein
MKRLFAMMTIVALASPAFAAKGASHGNHPMAGCGLGYALFGSTNNDQVHQIFAATTNGTSGNQTFGITSGTSGCTEDGAVKFVKEAEVYAEVNLDSLRREMAMGQGEFVTTFASLIGASDKNQVAMVKMFQSNYETLFPSSTTTSDELLASLKVTLAAHPELLS